MSQRHLGANRNRFEEGGSGCGNVTKLVNRQAASQDFFAPSFIPGPYISDTLGCAKLLYDDDDDDDDDD